MGNLDSSESRELFVKNMQITFADKPFTIQLIDGHYPQISVTYTGNGQNIEWIIRPMYTPKTCYDYINNIVKFYEICNFIQTRITTPIIYTKIGIEIPELFITIIFDYEKDYINSIICTYPLHYPDVFERIDRDLSIYCATHYRKIGSQTKMATH